MNGPRLSDLGALTSHRNFYELMRRVERLAERASLRPRGAARRRPDWLRLGQRAAMDFAATDIAKVEVDLGPEHGASRPPQLLVSLRSFGLFAPYGPLPLHVTEHAMLERKFLRNEAFTDFLNMLCAELAWLSYCAASAMSPVLGWERSRHPFRERLRSLARADTPVQQEGELDRHALACRQAHPGLYLTALRPLPPLAQLLSAYFSATVQVRPRLRRWLQIGNAAQVAEPTLGCWRLGSRVMDAQRGLELVVGPVTAGQYLSWRRNASALQALLAIVHDYTDGRLLPLVRILIRTDPSLAGRTGDMRIGQTSWLHPETGLKRLTVYDFSEDPL